jgi:hypothetical protein
MPTDRKPVTFAFLAAAALVVSLLLLGLYIGAYYRLVNVALVRMPGHAVAWETEPVYSLEGRRPGKPVPPSYWLEKFFAPIHRVDRRIRPHVWELMPLW